MRFDNESRKNLVQAGLESTTYRDQILSLKSHDILMKSMVNPTESPKMKSIHKHLEFVTLCCMHASQESYTISFEIFVPLVLANRINT